MCEASSGIWTRVVSTFCHLNPPLNDAANIFRQTKTTKNLFSFPLLSISHESSRNTENILLYNFVFIFIGPRSPGPIYVSGCHKLTKTPFRNLTDVTLADEDTGSILTDNTNRAIQGNVAMQVSQPGGQVCNLCK